MFLSGCVTNSSSSVQGNTVEYIADSEDHVEINFRDTSKLAEQYIEKLKDDPLLARLMEKNDFSVQAKSVVDADNSVKYTCTDTQCLFTCNKVEYVNGRPTINEGTVTYTVAVKKVTENNIDHISYTPVSVTRQNSQALLDKILNKKVEADFDIDSYLKNPASVIIKINKEYTSKYNQASVLGNLARHGIKTSADAKDVYNNVPLVLDLDNAKVQFLVDTFAYKNGSLLRVNEISIVKFEDNNASVKDIRAIKQKAIAIFESKIQD